MDVTIDPPLLHHEELPVIIRWAEPNIALRCYALLSPGRGKKSVFVRFDGSFTVPLPEPGYGYQSRGEEFDLATGRRLVWGQGMDYLADDWVLDEADRAAILAGGGG